MEQFSKVVIPSHKLGGSANGNITFLTNHLQAVHHLLPPEEKGEFLENPVEFVSRCLYFRGLTREKMTQLVKNRFMAPQEGRMNSRAVFETDSPYFALTCTHGPLSALAVIEPAKITALTELAEPGTEPYHKLVESAEIKSGLSASNGNDCFELQNYVDTICLSVAGHKWHNIELRKAQPLSEVCYFSVDRGHESILLDPNHPEDFQALENLYL